MILEDRHETARHPPSCAPPRRRKHPTDLDPGGGRIELPRGALRRGLPRTRGPRQTQRHPVRESIYIDAGEWLYHVSQIVTYRGMAHVHEGDKIEVAVHGKNLILRAHGKQYTTHIDQKSRS